MKQLLLCFVTLLLTFSSCERTLDVQGQEEGSSTLLVHTRAVENDEKVSYPLTVYAMNPDGVCVRKKTLLSENDELAFMLEPMTYHIYAIGGATEGDYELPGMENATATSEITLAEDALHGDLMSYASEITVGTNETNTLNLSLSRKVFELKEVTIKNIPPSVDEVSLVLNPMYDKLLLNGSYGEETSEKAILLTKQGESTWQLAEPLFLLPANGNPTINVKFRKGDAYISHTYSSPYAIEANKHILIEGNYTESEELQLTGAISGDTWNGTTVIKFNFNESGATAADDTGDDPNNSGDNTGGNNPSGNDNIQEGSAPAVNQLYKGFFVTNVEDDPTGEYVLVTLMHKDAIELSAGSQTKEQVLSKINLLLPDFDEDGITGWRLPTSEEAVNTMWGPAYSLYNNSAATDISNDYHYCTDPSGELNVFTVSGGNSAFLNHYTYSLGKILRPFTTVKFRK